jgi:hypothetical protein
MEHTVTELRATGGRAQAEHLVKEIRVSAGRSFIEYKLPPPGQLQTFAQCI